MLLQTRNAEEYFANKNTFTTGPVELSKRIGSQDIVIVDVREQEDYEKGHIPGAINLPENQWQTLRGLSARSVNVLYCYSQTCHLASRAAQFFARQGFPVMEMDGGFAAWKANEFEVED